MGGTILQEDTQPTSSGSLCSDYEDNDYDDKEEETGASSDRTKNNNNVLLNLCSQRQIILNHNVFLNLIHCGTWGLSASLWRQAVLSAYLKELYKGKNTPMGKIEASYGFANLVSSLPIGYLADKYGRSRVIRVGSVLMVCTAISHFGVLFWIGAMGDAQMSPKDAQWSMILLCGVMSLWGVVIAIEDGPVEALFADSVVSGGSKYYQYGWAVYVLATSLGPLISILLFQSMGDEWDMHPLKVILFWGLSIEFLNALIMWFYDDNKALVHSDGNSTSGHQNNNECWEDEHEDSERNGSMETSHDDHDGIELLSRPSSSVSDNRQQDIPQGSRSKPPKEDLLDTKKDKRNGMMNSYSNIEKARELDEEGNDEESKGLVVDSNPWKSRGDTTKATDSTEVPLETRHQWAPYVMLASSFISAAGSGITGKYFPLYLKDEVGMTPRQVQTIFVFIPIMMASFSSFGECGSKSIGRVPMVLIFTAISVSLFYTITIYYHPLQQQRLLLAILYILQSGIGEAVYPFQESLLMDAVPSHQRARWRAIQSISEYGWDGFAMVGGYISDREGYQEAFFVSCYVEVFALVLFSALLFLVPRKW